MTMKTSKIFICGASSKGPQHLQTRTGNQDSYMIKDVPGGKVLVVADGMGSAKHAKVGSKAICEAVCESCEIWSKYKKPQLGLLFQMIMTLWYMKISPYSKSDCGTTCIFVFYRYDGNVIMAQVGDGIIGYKIDENFQILSEKNEEFSNETRSVGKVTKLSHWNSLTLKIKANQRFSFFISTDGVSEDLIPEYREDFLEELVKICKNSSSKDRKKKIYKLLKNWPTPRHGDDKTIVIFEKSKYNINN